MPDVTATVYTRADCTSCDDAIATLREVASEEDVALAVEEVDVEADPDLAAEYGDRVPYVLLDGRPAFKYSVERAAARSKLRAAAE